LNLHQFYRLRRNGNHNTFKLRRNLEKVEALREKSRIAIQVSIEDEIEDQFQDEIV
jgi:hypothetical protein